MNITCPKVYRCLISLSKCGLDIWVRKLHPQQGGRKKNSFDNKFLRQIFGPTLEDGICHRMKYNEEIPNHVKIRILLEKVVIVYIGQGIYSEKKKT